jgi:CRISPR/Cas system-associated exonuclease Cas4 (RecB family)
VQGFGEWNVYEEIRGYIQSFKHWWQQGVSVLSVEQRFYCPELMITGQVDMIIETPEGAAILDLKTSYKPSKTWPLQGAAYAYMARKHDYDIKKILFLHLSKQGKSPDLYAYEDDFETFKKCLDVYRYFFWDGGKRVAA